MEKNKT
jgi:hypothetical protein